MKTALESRVVRWLIVCLVAFLAACFAIFSLNLLTPPRPLTALLPTRTAAFIDMLRLTLDVPDNPIPGRGGI